MSVDMREYPSNWKEIARRVKEQAGWRCEVCGHPHDPENGYCLTVHHLNRIKDDVSDSNLVCLCQRCHLRLHGLRVTPRRLYFKGMEPVALSLRRHDEVS